MPRGTPVGLRSAAAVAAALQGTVEDTFGPLGADHLFVDDANQIVITNSGELILQVRENGKMALGGPRLRGGGLACSACLINGRGARRVRCSGVAA